MTADPQVFGTIEAAPAVVRDEDLDTFLTNADLWAVIVWNDDTNTFDHVIKALIEILNHPKPRAEKLTMQVHNEGKAVVAIRPKDEAEVASQRFHARGIQASIDRA